MDDANKPPHVPTTKPPELAELSQDLRRVLRAGLPITPMSSIPFLAPPIFLAIKPMARPIAELAILPGLRDPELKLTWISWRIGPLMAKNGDQDPVLTSKVSKRDF